MNRSPFGTAVDTTGVLFMDNSTGTVTVPIDLWNEIVDFITDRVDVRDGEDWPKPNDAMSLSQRITEAGL